MKARQSNKYEITKTSGLVLVLSLSLNQIWNWTKNTPFFYKISRPWIRRLWLWIWIAAKCCECSNPCECFASWCGQQLVLDRWDFSCRKEAVTTASEAGKICTSCQGQLRQLLICFLALPQSIALRTGCSQRFSGTYLTIFFYFLDFFIYVWAKLADASTDCNFRHFV